jgi:hypothetical protein
MTDIERVYSDADVTRMILAGVDHPSLPSDYLTSEMARDRMDEIERLRAALREIANWQSECKVGGVMEWEPVLDWIEGKARKALGGHDD